MPIVVKRNLLKAAEMKLRELMISQRLIQHRGDLQIVATELGITRECLTWNIRKLGISVPELLVAAQTENQKKAAACANAPHRIPTRAMVAAAGK